jgi:hypothetical protein
MNNTATASRITASCWHLLLVLMVLLSLLGCGQSAHAQEAPPDLTAYTTLVREAFAAAQRSDRLGLEDLAKQLIAIKSVVLEDGQQVRVDNGWLARELDTSEPDLQRIAQRLGAIIDALAQPTSRLPSDALERLEKILNNPPFSSTRTESSWWSSFWSAVGRFLVWLLNRPSTSSSTSLELIRWLLVWGFTIIVIVVLFGSLGYFAWRFRGLFTSEAQREDDDPAAGLTANTALDQASTVARDGDYRSAMRYLYISALLWLDERNLLRYDRALTNREYLERLNTNPALRERLRPVVETFDSVWYGHQSLDADSFAAYRSQVESLRTYQP